MLHASFCFSPFLHLLCWNSFHSNNLFKFSRSVRGMIFYLLLLNNSGKWSLLQILFVLCASMGAWQGHSAIPGKAVCSAQLLFCDEEPSWAAHCCNLLDLIEVVFPPLLTRPMPFLHRSDFVRRVSRTNVAEKHSENEDKLLYILKNKRQ